MMRFLARVQESCLLAAYIALGHTRGQKLLPVPGGMAEARKPHDRLAPTVGPGRINEGVTFLEATANGWMHAIKDILNNTPEMALQVPGSSDS